MKILEMFGAAGTNDIKKNLKQNSMTGPMTQANHSFDPRFYVVMPNGLLIFPNQFTFYISAWILEAKYSGCSIDLIW